MTLIMLIVMKYVWLSHEFVFLFVYVDILVFPRHSGVQYAVVCVCSMRLPLLPMCHY